MTLKRLCPVMLPCLFFLAFAASTPARTLFAERQVLPPDRTVDVLVWLPPGDPALQPPALADTSLSPADPDSGWECARAGSAFSLSSCSLQPYQRGRLLRDQYLYWAFLNLSGSTRRHDLTAREEFQPALDALPRPLVAFKKQKDSCHYLVIHRDAYAPLAAGLVACPDLPTALAGLDRDLAGRTRRADKGPVTRDEKVFNSAGGPMVDRTPTLDLGVEGVLALAILMSTSTSSGSGPVETSTENFDLDDLAGLEGPPLTGRAYLLYRKLIGFRMGYEYSRMSLEDEFMSAFQSEIAALGGSLDDYRIHRHVITGELMLGRGFRGNGVEAYLGGLLGVARTNYSESATVDGEEEEIPGLLKDVTGALLGGQAQLRFLRFVQLGIEAGVHIKQFHLKNATRQPDGTATEFQARLALGFYWPLRNPAVKPASDPG